MVQAFPIIETPQQYAAMYLRSFPSRSDLEIDRSSVPRAARSGGVRPATLRACYELRGKNTDARFWVGRAFSGR